MDGPILRARASQCEIGARLDKRKPKTRESILQMKRHSMTRVILVVALIALAQQRIQCEASQQKQQPHDQSSKRRDLEQQTVIPNQVESAHLNLSEINTQFASQEHPAFEHSGPAFENSTSVFAIRNSSENNDDNASLPQTSTQTSANSTTSSTEVAPTQPVLQQKQQRLASASAATESSQVSSTPAAPSTVRQTNGSSSRRFKSQKSRAEGHARVGPSTFEQLANAKQRDLIDQMSTSQSVSFAEPLMAASNEEHQQHHRQPEAHRTQLQVSEALL